MHDNIKEKSIANVIKTTFSTSITLYRYVHGELIKSIFFV